MSTGEFFKIGAKVKGKKSGSDIFGIKGVIVAVAAQEQPDGNRKTRPPNKKPLTVKFDGIGLRECCCSELWPDGNSSKGNAAGAAEAAGEAKTSRKGW